MTGAIVFVYLLLHLQGTTYMIYECEQGFHEDGTEYLTNCYQVGETDESGICKTEEAT